MKRLKTYIIDEIPIFLTLKVELTHIIDEMHILTNINAPIFV